MVFTVPQPQSRPRSHPARPAAALGRRGLGDGHGFEKGETASRIVAGTPFVAAVDDAAHVGHGETAFGDVGAQHDFPEPGRSGLQDPGLFFQGQGAVELLDQHIRGRPVFQERGALPDLARSREKGQHVSRRFGDLPQDRPRHGFRDPFPGAEIVAPAHFHGELPARDDEGFSRFQQFFRPCGFERGGHEDDLQVAPERFGAVQKEREKQVAFDGAFVEFIENDGGGLFQRGILLEFPQQDAGSHGHDPRPGSAAALAPDGVARRVSRLFAQKLTDAPRGGRGGHPPGFHHEDPAFREFGGQGAGDAGGLARSGGGGQEQPSLFPDPAADLAQKRLDGELHAPRGSGPDDR